jgi:hypothetical protein
MKTLATTLLLALALLPSGTATQATDLTGKWNATFTMTRPNGQTQSITFTFDFTQKGKVLSGTIGPEPARQWKVEKGVVDGAKVTFQVQQPDGPRRGAFRALKSSNSRDRQQRSRSTPSEPSDASEMPGVGLEPTRAFWALRILSPVRLPVSPPRPERS